MGRMGLYEMFTFSDAIKELVIEDVRMQALKKAAIKEGMRPMRLSGAQKVAKGLTTVEEVLRVSPPVEH